MDHTTEIILQSTCLTFSQQTGETECICIDGKEVTCASNDGQQEDRPKSKYPETVANKDAPVAHLSGLSGLSGLAGLAHRSPPEPHLSGLTNRRPVVHRSAPVAHLSGLVAHPSAKLNVHDDYGCTYLFYKPYFVFFSTKSLPSATKT